MAFEFKFPDVGEGIHEGEIVRWRVAVGDEVKEDQPLVEMETAKAIVELPSPKAGTILALYGREGEVIHVGATLVVIGEKGEQVEKREEANRSEIEAGSKADPSAEASLKAGPGVVGEIPTDAGGIVLPPRKDEGTGHRAQGTEKGVFKEYGPIERVSLKGVRKAIAGNMKKSVSEIPHVTHMDEVDMTHLVKVREGKKPEAEKQGIKLTYLAFIVKAVAEALKKHPGVNAELDARTQEIVYKKYYNIGIAVDTPEGLMVPVIKDADKKDIFVIAREIAELAQKCRDRKISMEELQGGTFTITNVGSVGGIFATPIISPGQSGILGVFRMKERPIAVNGQVVIRPILTLALAFDHRVIDGADAARFMNELVSSLETLI